MKESCDKVASLTGEANTKDENSPPQLQDTQIEHILSDLSTFRKTVLLLTFALANFFFFYRRLQRFWRGHCGGANISGHRTGDFSGCWVRPELLIIKSV